MFFHDPQAKLPYHWDWSDWLDGDTISLATVTGDGVAIEPATQSAGIVTAVISGGTAGTNVPVTCRVTTVSGRIDDRTITLAIRNR